MRRLVFGEHEPQGVQTWEAGKFVWCAASRQLPFRCELDPPQRTVNVPDEPILQT